MANTALDGKPYAGNPHVRIDEGDGASAKPRRSSLLYKMTKLLLCFGAAAASLGVFADYTESVDRTLTQDETIAVDGVLTVSATVDLAGHKLTYTGVTDLVGTGTLMDGSRPYVPVDYLETTGQEYLSIGWKHTAAGYAVEAEYNQLSNGDYPCLFGNDGSYLCFNNGNTAGSGTKLKEAAPYLRIGGIWDTLSVARVLNEWRYLWISVKNGAQTLKYGPSSDSFETVTKDYSEANDNGFLRAGNWSWDVFAAQSSGNNHNWRLVAQLKYMKIWSSAATQDATTLVRDFIPVQLTTNVVDAAGATRARGTLGLWDRKEGKFYANAGGGAFTAPEVEIPEFHQGELHLGIAEGATCGNAGVAFAGMMKFVKEGAGIYAPTKTGQNYCGGTQIAAGVMKAQNTCYPCGVADTVTIDADGTLDINQTAAANGASAKCLYVFNGGSLLNTGTQGISWQASYQALGRVSVLVDSVIDTGNKGFGFQNFRNNATSCDLGGKTLTMNTGHAYFYNTTITGGGKIILETGGLADLAIGVGLKAPTTTFDTKIDLVAYDGIQHQVGTLIERCTATTVGGTATDASRLVICNVFTPVTDFINKFKLAAGATLDLSQRTTTFKLKSPQTNMSLELVAGATYTVNVAGRTCALGDCLVEWTPETEPNVTFVWDDTTAATGVPLVKTAQGLFYGGDPNDRTVVKATWTGAAGDGNLANPANWDCRNLAEVAVTGEDALPGTVSSVLVNGANPPQIPAGAMFTGASVTVSGALAADCDWRGLGDMPMHGTLDLAGHKLYLSNFAGDVVFTDATAISEPLDYIESTGTQLIDVGWRHGNAGYTVEIEYKQTAEDTYPCLFGNNGSYVCFNKSDEEVYARVSGTWNTLGQKYALNEWRWMKTSIKADAQTLVYGPTSETAQTTTKVYGAGSNSPAFAYAADWYVFAANCPQYQNTYPVKAQIRFMKIWSSATTQDATTLVRDFVPVRLLKDIPAGSDSKGVARTAGTLGLWDRVTDRFYANAGSGTFTAGEARAVEVTGGELHIDVPEAQTVGNATVALTGSLTLVKDGAGTFAPTKTGQSYKCGTVVAAGTFKAQNAFYPSGAQGVVTVNTNATLDINQTTLANGASAACLYRLNGGTIANTGASGVDFSANSQGLGRLEVLAPSFIRTNNRSFGFTNYRNGATSCEMNGQTLTIDLGTGTAIFYKLSVSGGGKIVVERADRADFAISPGVQAPTTAFETTTDLIPWDGLDHVVGGLIERRTDQTFNAQKNSHLVIKERYTPVTDFMNNFKLLANATIDLSVRHEPLPLTSTRTGQTLELPAEGTVYVAIGNRSPAGNNCLVSWTEETAPAQTLEFKRSPEDPRTPVLLERRADGLYFRSTGLTVIVH